MRAPTASFSTFSWISWVDCASQKATVATSLRIGISTEQSRPSSSATRGRACRGPFATGPRAPSGGLSMRGRFRGFFLSIAGSTPLIPGWRSILRALALVPVHNSPDGLCKSGPAQAEARMLHFSQDLLSRAAHFSKQRLTTMAGNALLQRAKPIAYTRVRLCWGTRGGLLEQYSSRNSYHPSLDGQPRAKIKEYTSV
uniref:Uncharacterized protein n=1 Tax=Ixodes ricinus TaxID=34613 RepID=A0A6B0V1F3_IXORI